LSKHLSLSKKQAKQLVQNSINGSFASKLRKKEIQVLLDDYLIIG